MNDTDPARSLGGIATNRRLAYAQGYLALGLIDDAAEELDAISLRDRSTPEVMTVRLAQHSAAGQWDIVANYARLLLNLSRDDVQAWVSLGCALRRVTNVTAARDALLEAVIHLGDQHAIILYNLACYHCLLGQIEPAKECLAKACRIDPSWKAAALDDDDLRAMWDAIASMS